MKTTKTLTIKNTILATFAVAGLVAGTAACGGKNTDSADAEKQALVELLLAAAQSGDAGEIADAIAQADPDLVAEVLPQLEDIDFEAPESATPEVVTPEAEITPEEDTAVTPEEEAAPETGEEVAPDEEAAPEVAPESDEEVTPEGDEEVAPEGDDSEFDFDLDLGFPPVTMPTMSFTPEIDGAMVFADGAKYRVTIFVNEGSTILLADIETVTVRFTSSTSPIRFPLTKQASLASSDGDSSIWTLSGLPVSEGDTLTITATNRMGETDTMNVVVSPMMPL